MFLKTGLPLTYQKDFAGLYHSKQESEGTLHRKVMRMDVTVENNKEAHRFQVEVDGFTAFIDYKLSGETITLVHTKVPSELEGRGLGSKLVKAALDSSRDDGLKVIPECPFVASYIERHNEYADLVAQ